jgi:hypothetical protein
MPKYVPAEAGFFRVELRVPFDRETAEQFRSDFDDWIGAMAESEFAQGLGNMPSIRLDSATEEYAELVLEWVGVPADGPWDAAEQQLNSVGKLAFPDLLTVPDGLQVTVTRVRSVGRDVVLDDETVARLEQEADERMSWPGDAPSG